MIFAFGLNFCATSLATCDCRSFVARLAAVSLAYQGFQFLDVFISEEELAVEVAQVDRVEVDDVDLSEANKDEVLQQFAANASSTDH